jgi:hypothetical protein
MKRVDQMQTLRGPGRLAAALTLAVALGVLGAPLPLMAATLAGVTLPDRIDVEGRTLVLNGLGLRKASIFRVKVYLAGLYLETRSSNAGQIMQSATRKRLVLHFMHEASRAQVTKAWRSGLRKNVQDMRPLEQRLAELGALIPNMKKGSRIILDFSADTVDVEIVGGARKTIAGADFARAMLGIWLGPKAPADDLQAALLGK